MKMSIVGLLRMAQRHLAILDDLQKNYPDILPSDIQSRFEVVSAEMILSELIENIQIVQKHPSQLEAFLRVYCIKND
jgi:hypothetical protein